MEPTIIHDPVGDKRPVLARWISSAHHQISPSLTIPASLVSPLSPSRPANNSDVFDCRTPESPKDGSSLAWPVPRGGLRRRDRERSSGGPPG